MRLLLCLAATLPLALYGVSARASEPEEPDAKNEVVGPAVTGAGLAMIGGGVGMLVAAESRGVTIGGALVGAFGTGVLIGGTATWMVAGLDEKELDDKVRQGGIALTGVGVGAVSWGGLMLTSSLSDASDVNDTTRVAGIIAAGTGGAGIIVGVILYAVGGPPPADEKASSAPRWSLGSGPGDLALTVSF